MCGISAIISVKQGASANTDIDIDTFKAHVRQVRQNGLDTMEGAGTDAEKTYLGGREFLNGFYEQVRTLKEDAPFFAIFSDKKSQETLFKLAETLTQTAETESFLIKERAGHLAPSVVETIFAHLEKLRDIAWCLTREIEDNVRKIREILYRAHAPIGVVTIFKRINAVLNSIDRLEVRGRDSAGISMLFVMAGDQYDAFMDTLDKANFMDQFRQRSGKDVLLNLGITVREWTDPEGHRFVTLAIVYKVAAEIGKLGDNVAFLRDQIKNDAILQAAVNFDFVHYSVLSHTRWASVGAISEPNCHPVDNTGKGTGGRSKGILHVCLNGDIDNYRDLKSRLEQQGSHISEEITTDTKIIAMQIDALIGQGMTVEEAFRAAVNQFEGSHAIGMHTDLAPGKLFLAQRGSGQAIFVGMNDNHYMAASEVYGFVEETSTYFKLDGEKVVQGANGPTQGQIVILDQASEGGPEAVRGCYYDGSPLELAEKEIKHTEITSRDIDRQGFPHYFLKEISESPVSVEKTIQNRWRVTGDDPEQFAVTLDDRVVPESIKNRFANNEIRRIFFVGQGTAGVAAQACAHLMRHYLNEPGIIVDSLKASEMSGFMLHDTDAGMSDTLVIAISQSGTTTDTNRTVDMVRERGAHTLAIVNRRDSDITFKVDGVMYTSSGRDIEMSVASTKAFYSQIVAGALLSLHLAHSKGRRNAAFVTDEIRLLLDMPDHMRKVLAMREKIELSARRVAVMRTYWAAVGSGPNKTSADEIRIKLSELCYKTISSDYVEDKKHIDLSSEPLIIICAAGTRETVLGDIIKDTAIFKAHKALPVVIASDGETRFDPYAEDVFHVPNVPEHLSPILNTLVGHIWGYYAALAINEGSRFLYAFRKEVNGTIDDFFRKGLDLYEMILEKIFREKMLQFYTLFRKRRMENSLPATMGADEVSDLTLLLKYLAGRLPVTDFELDFGVKGTARNMIDTLFECLGGAINTLARPIDAIKHQAKTVTVGTSRISEKVEGLMFDFLADHGFKVSQLTPANVIVLKNIQEIVAGVQGMTLYRIGGLNLLGEPTDDTVIEVVNREGTSTSIPSRVEKDKRLRGTKRIIVQRGNIYIGKGRKDNRSLICIPLSSATISATNMVENLMLLHVSFKSEVPLGIRIKALGGKFEHIKNIVAENSIPWNDNYLDYIEMSDLFGLSAEKIGEAIVTHIR